MVNLEVYLGRHTHSSSPLLCFSQEQAPYPQCTCPSAQAGSYTEGLSSVQGFWSLVVTPDSFWTPCLAQFTLPLSCVFQLCLMSTVCVISFCVLSASFCFAMFSEFSCQTGGVTQIEGSLRAEWYEIYCKHRNPVIRRV